MFMRMTCVFGANVNCGGRFSVCVIFKLMLLSSCCNVEEVNGFSLFFFDYKSRIGNCYVEFVENTVYVSKLDIV
jgi:hypothetical protein